MKHQRCRRMFVETASGRVYCSRNRHPADQPCGFNTHELPGVGWRTGRKVPQHLYYKDTPIVTLPAPVTYALVRFLNWLRPGT